MAIQVPTYDFNGAQVKVNLRTVAGLRQLFRVEFITQSGSVVSMEGQKFTGRVNTSPVTEFECVGNEEGVDIVWGRMPEGRYSYEVCCGSQVVIYGDMIVQGRMLPPLEGEGDVSVNDSLVMSVEADSEGRIAFECSEVGLMTLLERQAMVYMGESKELRDEVAQLHKAVENKVLEAESDITQKLIQAEAAQTNAEQSATLASELAEQVETTHGLVDELANQVKSDAEEASKAKEACDAMQGSVLGYTQRAEQAKVAAEEAEESAKQEAYNAYSHGSAARTSAEVALSKAEEAKTSAELAESKAEEAKTSAESAETLANELNVQYERAVFADNSGNVDIEGVLTIDGVSNLNGGAVIPNLSNPEMNKAVNLYGIMGFDYFRSAYIGKAIVNTNSILAGAGNSTVTKGISASLVAPSTKEPTIWKITFASGTSDVYSYNGLGGFFVPFWVESEGAQEWYKFSFLLQSKGSGCFTENLTINDKDSFVISPTTSATYCYNYDVTLSISNNTTEVRCRQLGRNSADEQMKVREVLATIPYAFNYSTRVRGFYVLNNIKTKKVEIFVLFYFSLFKVAEFQAFSRFSYEMTFLNEIYVSRPAVPDSISGSYGNMFNQETFWHIQNLNTGEYASPWSDFANLIAKNVITSNREYNYEFATEE